MKIEIDTKHDTKEELAHLANMLKAIAGSSSTSRGSSVMDSMIERKLARKGIVESASTASSQEPATGGIFNLFNDNADSQPASVPTEQQPVASGDMFSLFNSEPASQPSVQSQSAVLPSASPSTFDILSSTETQEGEKQECTTSIKDVLDDDRIVPY